MLRGKNIFLRCVKEDDLSQLYPFFDSIHMKGEFLAGELLSEYQYRLQFFETGFWGEEKGILVIAKESLIIGAIWYEKRAYFDGLDLYFYIFKEEHRNQGYMSEALHLFSSYLFATKKIERLQICIPNYSKAAIRLAQKCGFTFEGIVRSALFQNGKYLDLCLYSLIRSECKNIENIYS